MTCSRNAKRLSRSHVCHMRCVSSSVNVANKRMRSDQKPTPAIHTPPSPLSKFQPAYIMSPSPNLKSLILQRPYISATLVLLAVIMPGSSLTRSEDIMHRTTPTPFLRRIPRQQRGPSTLRESLLLVLGIASRVSPPPRKHAALLALPQGRAIAIPDRQSAARHGREAVLTDWSGFWLRWYDDGTTWSSRPGH